MPAGFTKPFSERLAWSGSIPLKEAADNDPVRQAHAFVAPADYHMTVKKENGGRIKLSKSPKVNSVRPSIDVTMKSAAEVYGDKTIGVLLSGMGKDGAEGMKAIKEKGGVTIVQDELSSVVFGMPKAAIDLGVVDSVTPLSRVVEEILRRL
jgi:two-component system chemotaxis response regulator CheB